MAVAAGVHAFVVGDMHVSPACFFFIQYSVRENVSVEVMRGGGAWRKGKLLPADVKLWIPRRGNSRCSSKVLVCLFLTIMSEMSLPSILILR